MQQDQDEQCANVAVFVAFVQNRPLPDIFPQAIPVT